MLRGYRFVGSLVLSTALAAPVIMTTQALAQDEHQHGYQDSDRHDDHRNDQRDQRYYDQSHREYHTWNSHEDAAYRGWLANSHHKYKDFNHQSRKQQQAYWNWRHDHPDGR